MCSSEKSATEGWLCAEWPFHNQCVSFLCGCDKHLAEGCANHSLTHGLFSTCMRICQSQWKYAGGGVWQFPNPSLLGEGTCRTMPFKSRSGIGPFMCQNQARVIGSFLWRRKKGLGTGVILCLHWFQRLFTCKCFCNFSSPFQHIYSGGKRFAQWWLQAFWKE